ncbi:MAG: hypothetical protein ACLTG4_02215 [Oscillospiraceae bacterium]
MSYNANMRQLMVDKLKSAELVVLNRYNDSIPHGRCTVSSARSPAGATSRMNTRTARSV